MILTGEDRNTWRETYPSAQSTTNLASGLYLKIQFVPRCKQCLGYKNKPVKSVNPVQGNNRCMFCDQYRTAINALHGQNVVVNHWALRVKGVGVSL